MIPKKINLLILNLLVAASSIIACGNKKQHTHTKLTPEEIRKFDEEIWTERAVLLASKYNLETQKILGLLIDLDNDTDDLTKDKLLSYSKKYQIKINVIAAIIIDSRSMSCPDCTCDCSRGSD